MDGPKAHNQQLLERYLRNLKEDGIVIVDNMYFHGYIDNPELIKKKRLKPLVLKMAKFKEDMLNHPDFVSEYIEIGDGLLICKRREKKMNYREGFVDFLNKSSSTYHAVSEVERQLIEAGFIKLKENTTWMLENNRYYYVVRNQSSLIAFKIPEIANVKSVNIIASHTDSPSLKIKPVADIKDSQYNRINVEIYGGALYLPG